MQIPVLLEYCARVAGRLQSTRLIRWAEIIQHQKADDLWLLIDGRVYDCTSWLPLHPGGKSLLLGLGKDATYLFEMCESTSSMLARSGFIALLADDLPCADMQCNKHIHRHIQWPAELALCETRSTPHTKAIIRVH